MSQSIGSVFYVSCRLKLTLGDSTHTHTHTHTHIQGTGAYDASVDTDFTAVVSDVHSPVAKTFAPLSWVCAVVAEFRCGKLKREGSKMTCVNVMQHA